MKKLLMYVPIYGIYYTVKQIIDCKINNESIHYLITMIYHGVITAYVLLSPFEYLS